MFQMFINSLLKPKQGHNNLWLNYYKLFDKFVAILADVVNDFAPIRKATCKEKKTQNKNYGLRTMC